MTAPRLVDAIDRIASARAFVIVTVSLIAFGGSGLLAVHRGLPVPRIHDEFSYLLASDTIARGRLTNPTHPFWPHFETIHVIHQPTYASKFPPAQGIVLGAGQALTGHPAVGVWLGMGLMAGAICWLLFGWLPERWAFYGSVLMLMKVGLVGYWADSYWGGGVAAAGGALALGALPRLARAPRALDSALLGAGAALLVNSRPYEGLLVLLPVGLVLLIIGRRAPLRFTLTRILGPFLLVLAVAGAWTTYYNFRVTGDPLRLPYQVHAAAYRVEPIFLWQPLRPVPAYRHETLEDFHAGFEVRLYRNQLPVGGYGFRSVKLDQLRQLWHFYLGPWLTLALAGLLMRRPDRWSWFALGSCGLLGIGLLMETWIFSHYAAPAAGLVFVLVVAGLQGWHRFGPVVGRSVAAFALVGTAVHAGQLLQSEASTPSVSDWTSRRARTMERLLAEPGNDLVFVRYASGHSVHEEWIYNDADIDAAPIVWARPIDADQDKALATYFRDRRVWWLDVSADSSEPRLTKYEWPAETPQSTRR